MNLVVNSLPARTWNRLGMNQALVDLEGNYKNLSPVADDNHENVIWEPKAETLPQGAQADLLAVLENAETGFALIRQGMAMEKPLVLRYDYEKGQTAASRLVLKAEKDSLLKVLLVLSAPAGAGEVSLLQTEIYEEENARVELSVVQLLSDNSTCVNHIGGILADHAHLELTRLELGSGKLYSGVNIDLQGRESDFHTEVGYHARPGQSLDMNYVANHMGVKTNSLMEVNGTLENGGRKIFRGTIDFRQGCAGAKGTENENVLLMGDDVVNQTIPLILCKEEDVEGNHGASIGQLDEKVLFYLGSRGFSREAAQAMIAQARIEAICEKLPEEAVREQVRNFECTRGNSRGEKL